MIPILLAVALQSGQPMAADDRAAPARENQRAPAAEAGQDRRDVSDDAGEAPDGDAAPDAGETRGAGADSAGSGDRAASANSALGRWTPAWLDFYRLLSTEYRQQEETLRDRDNDANWVQRRRDFFERGIMTHPPDFFGPTSADFRRVIPCLHDMLVAYAGRFESDPEEAFAEAQEAAQNCRPATPWQDFNDRLSGHIAEFVDQHLRP